MDIKQSIEFAVGGNIPPLKPLSIYEATMIPDSSVWASIRRARYAKRDNAALVRQKRLITAMERDIVDQLRMLPGVTIYDQDQAGNRYPITFLNGHIQDELIAVAHGIPGRPRDHLAVVADLISFEDFVQANQAEQSGNLKHFQEWNTMASLFAQAANVPAALLVLLCPRTGDMITRIVDRDDQINAERLEQIEDILEEGKTPAYVRAALGPNPVAVHCRTCVNCNPTGAGDWVCNNLGSEGQPIGPLTLEAQQRANDCHLIHPAFIPLEVIDQPENGCIWFKGTDGSMIEVLSEEQHRREHSTLCDKIIKSSEAAALSGSAEMLTDQNVDKFKERFNAELS